MTCWFTSDLHLGHENIRTLVPLRGETFSDLDHMNTELVRRWNERVLPDDVVYCLGDMVMGQREKTLPMLSRLNGRKLLIMGNHDNCLSYDMRAVSREGFVGPEELQVGEEVLSCDDNGYEKWVPVERVIRKRHAGEMVTIRGNRFDVSMTADHRFITLTANGVWREYRGEQIGRREFPDSLSVVTSTRNRRPDFSIPDAAISLLGWCVTDGHVSNRGYWTLYQRESNAPKIRTLLDELELSYSERHRERDITHIMGRTLQRRPENSVEFSIGAKDSRGLPWTEKYRLPEWAWRLSSRQFEVLLDAIVDGDGSYASNGHTIASDSPYVNGVIYCNKASLCDDIRRLMLVNGYSSSVNDSNPGDIRLNFCKSTQNRISRTDSEIENSYRHDPVWCVSVETGRFFVERGGKVHLTGNCWPHLWKTSQAEKAQRWKDAYWPYFKGLFTEISMPLSDGTHVHMHHFPYLGDSHAEDRYADHRPKDLGVPLLHGHVHDAWRTATTPAGTPMVNVGVDVNGFAPVSEQEILSLLS